MRVSIVSTQFLFILLILSSLEVLCYLKSPSAQQDKHVISLVRHPKDVVRQRMERPFQEVFGNSSICSPQPVKPTPCVPCVNRTIITPCKPFANCTLRRIVLPCPSNTTPVQSDMRFSWSFLHDAYIDRVSFYQIQSPEKCLLNHFLYPINKELFFVNEAQVSFPTSVVIATNRYNMMCNGSDIIHYRQTSIQTAVTNVPVFLTMSCIEFSSQIHQCSSLSHFPLQKHLSLQ